ncbi:MAG: phosphatase PAP2 family protein [Bryobacterales bacterium]|nr:phosphatase PAP2 family protein [Bryobacterales bacterium]
MTISKMMVLAAAAAMGWAQETPHPGDWKTWVIASGREHAVAAPPSAPASREELEWVKAAVRESNAQVVASVRYWDAGPPAYRWMEMIAKRQSAGQSVGTYFARAYAYAAMAAYDATVAAWHAKRQYGRARPTEADGSIRARVVVPAGGSYPSDYSATAFAVASVMAYLVPGEAERFIAMAEEAGKSRLYAGVEYPSDYQAGRELGERVAAQVVAKARIDGSDAVWTGTVPSGRCMWTGTNPGNVTAANWKPVLLLSPSEFRPEPPPACDSPAVQADLAGVRSYPRALSTANLVTNARALYWQTPEGVFPWAILEMNRWMLEDKMEREPARAARAYALVGAAGYDAFIASQDGKFAYWYPRPAQLDSSLAPLFPAPNFPSYPSNHSTLSASRAEVLAYLFPQRAEAIRAMAKEAGDSRIWAGIHFEMDNEAGMMLGRKVAGKFVEWAENDGSSCEGGCR